MLFLSYHHCLFLYILIFPGYSPLQLGLVIIRLTSLSEACSSDRTVCAMVTGSEFWVSDHEAVDISSSSGTSYRMTCAWIRVTTILVVPSSGTKLSAFHTPFRTHDISAGLTSVDVDPLEKNTIGGADGLTGLQTDHDDRDADFETRIEQAVEHATGGSEVCPPSSSYAAVLELEDKDELQADCPRAAAQKQC
ncbi:hypothetical protein QBC36DRAFT_139169 [Triangularia setosa]|uniref:Uncharacterized protein n=1 Tax=Triangularia setosa TaxID=2587417 RepID=A0AAN7A8F0_9PEZI|nr:hypothetical protein QBC36DRAFT_139169 [Podospora setosa]